MSHVWYVAYGSNILRERLTCYLAGGRPAGGLRANPGARDPSPPSGDLRVDLPHPLMYGGPSLTWRGGPAYLDVEREGRSIGRAWRITREQFEDVVAQENGLQPGSVRVPGTMLTEGGVAVSAGYGRIVPLPSIQGETCVTLTYVSRPAEREPDPAYVALIRRGHEELDPGPS